MENWIKTLATGHPVSPHYRSFSFIFEANPQTLGLLELNRKQISQPKPSKQSGKWNISKNMAFDRKTETN